MSPSDSSRRTHFGTLALLSAALWIASCGGSDSAGGGGGGNGSGGFSDTSGFASEAAASLISGAVSSTAADPTGRRGGRVACPNVANGQVGVNCSTATNQISFTYPSGGCTMGGLLEGTWNGGTTLAVTPIGVTADPTCGSSFPAITDTTFSGVTRTYAGTIASGTYTEHTNTSSISVAVDTTTLTGFLYTPTGGGGYVRLLDSVIGTNYFSETMHIAAHAVAYTGTIASGTLWDYTISTVDSSGADVPLNINHQSTTGGTFELVSGNIYLQNNVKRNLAKATVAVTFTLGTTCCFPTDGQIIVQYLGTTTPPQEILDFSDGTACGLSTIGQVQFTDINGAVTTRTLTHCL